MTVGDKLENHALRTWDDMLFMTKIEALDEAAACGMRLRQQAPKKVGFATIMQHNREWTSINKKISYEDNEWRKKNYVEAFLEITDVRLLPQAGSENISLFDVMTKTSILGIYREFDWGSIEDHVRFTENNFQGKSINYREDFYPKLAHLFR